MKVIKYDLSLEKLVKTIEALLIILGNDNNIILEVVPSNQNDFFVTFYSDVTHIKIRTEILSDESDIIKKRGNDAIEYLKQMIADCELSNKKAKLLEELLEK